MNLAIINSDTALYNNEPQKSTYASFASKKAIYKKWDYSNKVCLMFMKYYMKKSIKQSIPNSNSFDAKEFLKAMNQNFVKFDKAKKGQYLSLIEKTKYDGVSGVREHIMKLVHYFNKLKSMKVDMDDSYLIWMVLEYLPSQYEYNILRTAYNANKIEWSINELIFIVTQEEANLKRVRLMFMLLLVVHLIRKNLIRTRRVIKEKKRRNM